ncbi:hypothetical protein H0H92_014519 [Tricholoma furcatifolium]|nr:hypothetical protein H0H92_014519 [Tricholoma furcatifolium]
MPRNSKPAFRSKPRSNKAGSKPASTKAKTAPKQNSKQTSVSRLQDDLASEAAGPPESLQLSEQLLESSGISVAPPKHQSNAQATIMPCLTRHISARVRRSAENQDRVVEEHSDGKRDLGGNEVGDLGDVEEGDDRKGDLDVIEEGQVGGLSEEVEENQVRGLGAVEEDQVRGLGEVEEDQIGGLREVEENQIGGDRDGTGNLNAIEEDQIGDKGDLGDVVMEDEEDIVTPHKKTGQKVFVHDDFTPHGRDLFKRLCAASVSSERASKVSRQSDAHSSAASLRTTSISSGHDAVDLEHDRSISPVEAHGSSCSTGDIIRGHAIGSAPNVGDFDMARDESQTAIEGKVLLYDSKAKNNTAISFNQPIGNNLGQVLQNLSFLYSPVKKANSRIYVKEDGMWALKEKYDYAVQSKDSVK